MRPADVRSELRGEPEEVAGEKGPLHECNSMKEAMRQLCCKMAQHCKVRRMSGRLLCRRWETFQEVFGLASMQLQIK